MLALKRVYDEPYPEDGARFLVERLWPRGIKKADLRLDACVAPSTPLRRWFGHPEECDQIRKAARHGRVTLLYSSHDTEHNNAVALQKYLSARTGKKGRTTHA